MEAKWMLVAMVRFLPQLLLGNEWTPGDRVCTCLYMMEDVVPSCTILLGGSTSSENKIQLPPTSVPQKSCIERQGVECKALRDRTVAPWWGNTKVKVV